MRLNWQGFWETAKAIFAGDEPIHPYACPIDNTVLVKLNMNPVYYVCGRGHRFRFDDPTIVLEPKGPPPTGEI